MKLITRYINKETFSSLRIRNFRLYFFGQAVSLTGTWMQTVAQSWLVLQLSGSGTVLGQVWGLQFVPILLFGPLAGVIVDRFSKKKLLYATQLIAAVLSGIMALLVFTGDVQLWMVYILALGIGLVTAIDNPARQTFVLELVGKDQLTNAVTLNTAELYLTRVIGPALAATMIATVGMAACFLLNAISFAAVIFVLYYMRDDEIRPAQKVYQVRGKLKEGIKYVLATPILRNSLAMMFIVGTLTYEFAVNLPLLAKETFMGDAATFAALTAALGTGSVIGGILIAQRKHATGKMLVVASFFFGLATMATAMMPSFRLSMLMLAVVGLCSINFMSLSNVILQFAARPDMRGRVMALWTVAFMGSTVIGGPLIGWVGETYSPRWGLGISGMAAVVASVLGAFTLTHVRRRFTSLAVALHRHSVLLMEEHIGSR